ncbi:hypothetical protein ACIRPX_33950 [Streptomyces sp. NPDC101225]|uniref:hypothetical protein n=1 Tax=Streptomyces sp. NPDC101225 TaxID=3366135 RepID=UPI00380CF3DE
MVRSADDEVPAAGEAVPDADVHLPENLTGRVCVDPPAALSDVHGGAADPAACATLSDAAFVTRRYFVLPSRRPVTAPSEESARCPKTST